MKKRNLLISFLVVAAFVAIFLIPSPVSRKSSDLVLTFSQPLSKSAVAIGRKIADAFSVLTEIGTLRRENQRLEEELVKSRVDSAKLSELEAKNQNLEKQLEYKNFHPEMKLILANVIGLDPTNFYDTIVVDKGLNDGVSAGMAVILFGSLVGKIDQVSVGTSRVVLISSKDSIVQVMLQSSRTTGILRGGISGMTLENIPLDTPIALDENVITSGLGGKLPKGIFVGNTGKEISAKSDIFKTVEIKSAINFSKLETLFIVAGG